MPADSWTTLADLRALSLKAWSSGSLLRELLEPSRTVPAASSVEASDGGGPPP